jgi:acyl-coenzyme A thioesterase PaaI-like protein
LVTGGDAKTQPKEILPMSANEANGLSDEGLFAAFLSPNVKDPDGQPLNVVDVIIDLAWNVRKVAHAITPQDVGPGSDNHGGVVTSLTEAVMSVAASLDGVGEGLHAIAEAIRDTK